MNDEESGGPLIREMLNRPQPIPHQDRFRFNIAVQIIVIFAILMRMCLVAALWGSSTHAMEAINLLGHIFGPLLGMIMAFYFAAVLNR